MAGDPIAQQTDWNPANKDGSNIKIHRPKAIGLMLFVIFAIGLDITTLFALTKPGIMTQIDDLLPYFFSVGAFLLSIFFIWLRQEAKNLTHNPKAIRLIFYIIFAIGLNITTLFALAKPGTMPQIDDITAYFFSIGAFLLSIFFIWLHQRTKKLIEDAQMWPIVIGKVVLSDIETIIETHREPGGSDRIRRNRKVTRYKPQVRYKYTINGKTFTGHRRNIIDELEYKDITEAEKICKQFPRKSQVNVYYNPADPSEAYLDRSKKNNDPNVILVPAVFFGLVGFLILAFITFG